MFLYSSFIIELTNEITKAAKRLMPFKVSADSAMNFFISFSIYLIPIIFSYLLTRYSISAFLSNKSNNAKFSQPISKFIEAHNKKNVPIFGGVFMLISLLISTLLIIIMKNLLHTFCPSFFIIFRKLTIFSMQSLFPVCLAVSFAAIGFIDDLQKVKYRKNSAMSAKTKFLLQIITASICVILFRKVNPLSNLSYIDKISTTSSSDLNFLSLAWQVFVIVGTANAVNLTDGIDGLAGNVSKICIILLGFISNKNAYLCFCMVSIINAFLRFNNNPAKIFMGDTGSLLLGSFMSGVALESGVEWTFAISGGVFIMETLSVILQIASVKLFKKRIFPITPIHHYFEKHYTEKEIVYYAKKITLFLSFIALMISLLN
ncbi:phospho-N-acetylmuramoyl-pentapeptide-transferase [Candidatus Nesciobacter abundans]|uniref:Phospho-N-acetylmuramoyl-pentapeptide-transferase n=1 Tax=Candidatus Nesciobacter abundans TaxID=2601668 RepID=A0A5C0UHN6_9PROT|nr:phospho-N-acetylmuramoyl-pentapeptide-transferase [Candidatus Nesciobacter abundans]QEK39247.1 phospho-N-acetylmuramoyl-pentapeptide-transferase [Candidatus Nesciobacter abundans]